MKKKNLLILAAVLSPFGCMAETTTDAGPSVPEIWIAFLPVIFFLLILLVTTIKLRNDKTKLSDLLAEKDPQAAAVGAAGDGGATPTSSQSVSRFIAFLTGLTALALGACISTFYMYSYFSNPSAKLDLSNLTNVIWGLGIGVLPYGFNKASSALKPNS